MSSNRVNPPDNSQSGPHYSVFNADPAASHYPTVPKVLRNGVLGRGRHCEVCSKVIGLGMNGSLYAYNSHVNACRKKHPKPASTPSDHVESLPVTPSTTTTAVPGGGHRSPSLSPLIIGGHLHPSRSPSPSPTYSPTSPLMSVFFDARSNNDISPSTSVQAIPAPPFIDTNPTISINPPSDDLLSPTMALHSPQSRQATPVACSGVLVQWTLGTIWETYPFPSHSAVNHPWDIIEFRPPSHLCLRSKACAGVVSAGGHRSTCHHCVWIPQCDRYKTIEKRAHDAPPHTPHHLLAFHQLSDIPKTLRKMLNEARLKVIGVTGI